MEKSTVTGRQPRIAQLEKNMFLHHTEAHSADEPVCAPKIITFMNRRFENRLG
jgi:hypothetical protein